jgi:hypothetical protein
MDPVQDKDLFWIAKEGLKAPLPDPWKPCKTAKGEIYYFNFQNGDSTWEHPCDQHYQKLFREEKTKRAKKQQHSKAPQPEEHQPDPIADPSQIMRLPTKQTAKLKAETEVDFVVIYEPIEAGTRI